ncbi:Uncharacterized protein Fot_25590 [Forsythia ovata]|uniref:Uncharacterized protein n=1 Tax=Forsythia ovata TaxID=205694 RepID=A0ABD1U9H6_9LAMI
MKKKNPVALAATITEEIFNDAAPLSSDVGASALGASLAAGPKASRGLDLLGAGGDEGSSVGDSTGGDESEGGEAEGVEDFGAEDFGAGTRDDDLGTETDEYKKRN